MDTNSTNQKVGGSSRSRGSEVLDDWVPKKSEFNDRKFLTNNNKVKKQKKKVPTDVSFAFLLFVGQWCWTNGDLLFVVFC